MTITRNPATQQNLDQAKLCLELFSCDTENEVTDVLKRYELFYTKEHWKEDWYTYGIIHSQMSDPLGALSELLVNSSDSLLISKCKERGIDPYGEEAPKSADVAVKKLLGWDNNALTKLPKKEYEKLLGMIIGGNDRDTITVFDSGEGQAPNDFKSTFLDIGPNKGSNKKDIGFTMGRFGGGSSATFEHSRGAKYKLIISRKNPNISDCDSDEIGWTIIRYNQPDPAEEGKYQYLHFSGEVGRFSARTIQIIPSDQRPFDRDINWDYGCIQKLYNYSPVNNSRDLYSEINLLLVKPNVPLIIHDDGNKGKNQRIERTVSGFLNVVGTKEGRLHPRLNNKPLSGQFTIDNEGLHQKISWEIYVFEEENHDLGKLLKGKHVLYTLGGQCQYFEPGNIFGRNKVRLDSIAKQCLMILDFSDCNNNTNASLFKADRETLRNNEFKQSITKAITQQLSENKELKSIALDKEEKKAGELSTPKAKEKLYEDLSKRNPMVSDLFSPGKSFNRKKIKQFRSRRADNTSEPQYNGRFPASSFDLKNPDQYSEAVARNWEIGSTAKIKFSTDAPDDFFSLNREGGHGWIDVYVDGVKAEDESTTAHGQMTVSITSVKKRIGDKVLCEIVMSDTQKKARFRHYCYMTISQKTNKPKPRIGVKAKLPKTKWIKKDEWPEYDMKDGDVAKYLPQIDTFIFNEDTATLQEQLQHRPQEKPDITMAFKEAIEISALIANKEIKETDSPEKFKEIMQFSAKSAVVLTHDLPQELTKAKKRAI
ncbi:MAG: hypothetical protein CMO98_13910 [Woeseia sp.]|nr:hypothetical protein [Woeseia sp.]